MKLSKFRAFDSLRKVMIATGYHVIGEVTMFGIIDQYIAEHLEGKSYLDRYIDVIESQFSGVLVKNGKEIYDGDVLGGMSYKVWLDGTKVPNSEYMSELKQVIWLEDSWGYITKLPHLPKNSNSKGLIIPAKYFRVIGNIFENPELEIK